MSNISYPKYKLPDDLNVNSVTASSGFDGDLYGTASYALNSDQFDGKDSALFALKTDVTDAIANFPTRLEVSGAVTGALEPYAKSTDVSSSFVSQLQATASLARLTADNNFSGINTFNNSVTGSNALFTGNITVNGTASINSLNTIESNHLKIGDKYITILSGTNSQTSLDGSGILFGSGSSETPVNDQNSVASILYRNDAADGKIEIFPGLRVTGSVQVTGGITGSISGTLYGPAGGILSGTYPSPSALIGAYTSSLYSIIPLSSSNSTRTAALMTGDSSTTPNSLVIKTGDSPSPSNKAGSISILAGSSSYVGIASPYNGDISIVSEGDELIRAATTIRLIAGNYTPTLSSYGIYIEANPPAGMTDYISIGSNKPAGGGTLRSVDIGKSANAVTLGTASAPVYTMGQDMRVPQYRTITNINSTMAINAGTVCLSATSNITMSGKPVMDVYTPDTPGQTPDGCRVTLMNISDFDIAFPNDLSTTPVSPYSTGTYLSSSLKLGAQQRVLKKWGTLELQFQKSGSSSTSGGYWVETNYSNNLTGSYDLSAYATLTGVSASFTTPTQVSGVITGALSPYARSTDVSSSFGLKTDISSSFARLAAPSSSFVGHISASNISSSGIFYGDGSGIYNLPASAVDLSGYAKLAGGNTFTSGDQTITGSVYITSKLSNGFNSLAGGDWSHAEGGGTTASGRYSHAEGANTIASNYHSHAEGELTLASGQGSHAEGYLTTASSLYSHAEGENCSTPAFASHAEGYNSVAGGGHSHAEGEGTTTYGSYSHAEGWFAKSYGLNSHAEGLDARSHGFSSHAEGQQSEAHGEASHSEGFLTKTYGTASHAEGHSSEAHGDYSHAEGSNTRARGPHSHAEGDSTNSSGSYSHAEGTATIALGQGAHAEGRQTYASSPYSHTEGYHTTASANYQHVQGRFNVASSTAIMIVGDGTSVSDRHNILEVYSGSVVVSGTLQNTGGIKVNISNQTSDYIIDPNSDYIITFSGTNLTGTLPDAALSVGSTFIIKNKDTSPLFITSSGGLIDGLSDVIIDEQYYSYTLVSDGVDWNVI